MTARSANLLKVNDFHGCRCIGRLPLTSEKLVDGSGSNPITQIDPLPSGSDRVLIVQIHLRTANLRNSLFKQLRSDRGKGHLRSALKRLIQPPVTKRERAGELQPEIPRTLREALRTEGAAVGPRGSNARVQRELEAWINFGTGRRRTRVDRKTGKPVLLRPRKGISFKERGRALMREQDVVRFTFNAGNARNKRTIEKLLAGLDMNLSEFFSALIERMCAPIGQSSPSNSVTTTSNE